MKTNDTDLLLRLLNGELTPADEADVQRRLAASADLRDEWLALRATQNLLRSTVDATAQQALKPFFTDRLMRRLEPKARRLVRLSPEEEFFGVLWHAFRPVAVAAILLILAIASYNASIASEYETEQSATEVVLALPPVTLTAAYDVDY